MFGIDLRVWAIQIVLKITGGTKMLQKIRAALTGKKTYIVAVVAIGGAIVEYITTGDIATLIKSVIAAVTAMTIRAAVSKTATDK